MIKAYDDTCDVNCDVNSDVIERYYTRKALQQKR